MEALSRHSKEHGPEQNPLHNASNIPLRPSEARQKLLQRTMAGGFAPVSVMH